MGGHREWPKEGIARIPYWIYSDREIYVREQERIFCGPSWSYVALEAELPHPGDFKRTCIGEKPVVVVRDKDGAINVLENRCAPRDLRLELEELYAAYAGCLDEERFEEWPEFFIEQCLYKIIPRENFERGLPLATWLCESKGYMADRVVAIRKTAVYAPRYMRRMVSGIRVLGWKEGVLEVRANYAALETLQDEFTRIFNTGQYRDKLVVEGGKLKFSEKLCIFDSLLVPNSLIYPL